MTDPGLPLVGGQLHTLAPDATGSDQTAAINGLIQKLNGWNGVIVAQGTTAISSDGTARNLFTVAHNLGYAPVPFAYLNSVNISGTGSIPALSKLNIPLPHWLGISTNGILSGGVAFTVYISIYVDATNFYIDVFNATGAAFGNFNVSYYLMRIQSAL